MDYFWDILHSVGLTTSPPSSAIFPESYRDIQRDYTFVGNADMAVMGRGTWGIVRRVQRRTTEMRKKKNVEKFACKTILKSAMASNLELLRREVYNLRRCQQAPHVVKLVDIYEDYNAVHIIMEQCKGMELYEELQLAGDDGLEEEKVAKIIHQALSALAYMHDVCHVAHRDIKASNFIFAHLNLMKEDGKELEIKLIDFGLSKHAIAKAEGKDKSKESEIPVPAEIGSDVNAKQPAGDPAISSTPTMDANDSDDELLKNKHGVMTSEVGTPYYTAPEVLTQKTYDFKCDVYSVGVLAYLCLTGKLPIKGKNERDTIKKVMKGKTSIDFSDSLWLKTSTDDEAKESKEGEKPKSSQGQALSESAREFCKALLQRDPKDRPTAFDALQLEWMTSRFGEPTELPPPMPDNDEQVPAGGLKLLRSWSRSSKGSIAPTFSYC